METALELSSVCGFDQAILEIVPFTLSHAAAAIPFRRTPLIMSALVMGCCVPDFPYLLSLSPDTSFSHTFAGIFVLDLPLAIVALWVYHTFIKPPILLFLPSRVRQRLPANAETFPFWQWKRLSLLAISVLIGTATHLVWDAFTHPGTWIFQNWALLRRTVELPVVGKMQMYKLLEYANSFVGLAVVACWIGYWYRTTEPSATPVKRPAHLAQTRTFVAALAVLATLIGALRAWRCDGIHLQIRPIVHFTTNMLISAITFFLLGLLICGAMLRLCKKTPVRVEDSR